MKLSPLILCLCLTSCGELLFPKADNTIYTSFKWGVTVSADQATLEKDLNKAYIDKFIGSLDEYMDAVMVELHKTGLLEEALFVPGNEYVKRLNVTISYQLAVRGHYARNAAIALHPEDKMISVFGHELVRFLLHMSGDTGSAFSSSLDWSGDVGILWNIAETTSLEFI